MIEAPRRSDGLRLSWGLAVTDAANRMGAMTPAGMLVREGATGFGFERLPENQRRNQRSAMNPFVVRHVDADDEAGIPYTGWEIYMPTGCVTVDIQCSPLNPKAYREGDDGRKDLLGWYRLPAPDDDGSDGDKWAVMIHVKGFAAVEGVDEFTNRPKSYVWASIEEPTEDQEEIENDVNSVGDTLSTSVGTIEWTEDEDENVAHHYIQSITTPIITRGEGRASGFQLLFAFSVDDDGPELSLERMFVRNMEFSAGGASFLCDGMTEIDKEHEGVYLVIHTATTPYTAEIRSYATLNAGSDDELTTAQQAEDDKEAGDALLLLFRLKNGHVTLDGREAIRNIQFYSS